MFFADADDTVRKDFFRRPLSELERTGADLCLFGMGDMIPPRRLDLTGRSEIHAKMLNSFVGYSMDDVRRWNRGGSLGENRTLGSVCRCAFRRGFLERHALKFNERMTFYEDCVFLMRAVAYAERAVEIADPLFDYEIRPDGNFSSGVNSRRHWQYKLDMLHERLQLEREVGDVWRHCEASAVLGFLEMIALGVRLRLPLGKQFAAAKSYLAAFEVRAAFRRFPISLRHPLLAAAVLLVRVWSWIVNVSVLSVR